MATRTAQHKWGWVAHDFYGSGPVEKTRHGEKSAGARGSIFLHLWRSDCRFSLVSQQFSKDVVVDGVRGRGQNLFLGILSGTVAAIVGALIWMGITVATGMHIGYVAIGVGALVGLAVRYGGNGTGMIFGIVGAVLTLLGCLGGEVLTVIQLSVTPERDFYHTLTAVDLSQLLANLVGRMDTLMYVIYGIGIFEGYKLSIRK